MSTLKEILQIIMTVVIIPAIPILAKYFVDALKEWVESKSLEIEDKTISNYLTEITDIISQAVISTTQTYVDSLKAQGKFDAEAQKVAFEKTKVVVLSLLTQEAKDFITQMYGDLDLWLNTKIEQLVKEKKNVPVA